MFIKILWHDCEHVEFASCSHKALLSIFFVCVLAVVNVTSPVHERLLVGFATASLQFVCHERNIGPSVIHRSTETPGSCSTTLHASPYAELNALFCREQLCHTFSPMLRLLCEWATNQLETLSKGGQAGPQPTPPLASYPAPHMSDRQCSADQLLSESCGHEPVKLTRLSVVLSSVQAAARGGQSAWTQQTGVHQLLQLMQHITEEYGGLINMAVGEACR